MWIKKSTSSSTSSLQIEDFSIVNFNGVTLDKPYDTKNIVVLSTTKNSITLQWDASESQNVTSYQIYVNGSLNGTTGNTSYTISSLSPSTSYIVNITAKDSDENESDGKTITCKTSGTYAYSTIATPASAITLPKVKFHYIEIVASINPVKNSWNTYFIGFPDLYTTDTTHSTIYWQFAGTSLWNTSPYIDKMFIDGSYTDFTVVNALPTNTVMTIGIQLTSNVNTSVKLFSNGTYITPAQIYEVRLYTQNSLLEKTLVGRYNFTDNTKTASINDEMGNYPSATISNGNYISV